MKGLFGPDKNQEIVSQLCRDLDCPKEEVLNEVYRLCCNHGSLDSEREALKQSRDAFICEQKQEREKFKVHCEEYERNMIVAGSEKAAELLAECKTKCLEMEREAKSRKDALENEAKELESKLSFLEQAESQLNALCKISEDKEDVVACTRDDAKAIFRRSDFERDARFLSCGLYPFLFSENFKGIERVDGSRELKDLDGDDLKMLAQGMKHVSYKVKNFKNLDKSEGENFNARLDPYCLHCKNGVLDVLGMEPDRSVGWSDVKEVEIEVNGEKKEIIYYVVNLGGVDFEFVAVPLDGDSDEVDYMMSTAVNQGHWVAVTGENPAYFAGCGLDLPMESVSYEDIVTDFLPKLNRLLTEAGFEGEFKLPRNDQWQNMADKNVASDFASNKSKYADFGKEWHSDRLSPVKSKTVGRLGACMFGGVWEWVRGIDASGYVAIRGGSWNDSSESVGPSARYSNRSVYRNRNIGFRVLRTFPGQA